MRSTLSSLFSNFRFASASSWFELYASFTTFMMLLRTAINQIIPKHIQSLLLSKLHDFLFKPQLNDKVVSLTIDDYWEDRGRNEVYNAAQKCLPSCVTQTYTSLWVGKVVDGKSKNLEFMMDESQHVVDEFEGNRFTWRLRVESSENAHSLNGIKQKKQALVLTFNEKYREKVMDRYIPYVLKTYEAMTTEQKIVKFHSWDSYSHATWKASELLHPGTFDTLALDPQLKQKIIDDVELFLKRKELYKKVGKPYKRGYLLYGPPGIGKSTLIAALANYLKFDVYDLDLTSVSSDQCLKRMVCSTPKRSIIVIEDIDCNKEVRARSVSSNVLGDRKDKGHRFSLSSLLNQMDGLGSGRGDEKIIIFTTNHKDRIDPALLRAGRMDLHIELSFLKAKAFRVLASNYLDIQDHHPLFDQIEELLEKIEVTPAVVAEQLLRHDDPDITLDELLKFLKEMEMKMEAEMPDDKFEKERVAAAVKVLALASSIKKEGKQHEARKNFGEERKSK